CQKSLQSFLRATVPHCGWPNALGSPGGSQAPTTVRAWYAITSPHRCTHGRSCPERGVSRIGSSSPTKSLPRLDRVSRAALSAAVSDGGEGEHRLMSLFRQAKRIESWL